MSDTGCFVCEKHRGRIDVPGGCLFEDELVYSTHGIIQPGKTRDYLGTLFVEPKRHVPGIAELTDAEAERIGRLSSRLARALKQTGDVDHTYVHVWGHHVAHLHVWIVPRYRGTPAEFLPMQMAEWTGAPTGDAHEIADLCSRIRLCLG